MRLVSSWQKSPICEIDRGVHEKVFSKLITLIKHVDEDSEVITKECASIVTYIGSMLANMSLLPARISKSDEGSIAFEFEFPNRFASIEVFNDEEIVFLQDRAGHVSADNLTKDQIGDALAKLG